MNYSLVLFCFALNVTDLLGDLLKAILVVGVLQLKLLLLPRSDLLGHDEESRELRRNPRRTEEIEVVLLC